MTASPKLRRPLPDQRTSRREWSSEEVVYAPRVALSMLCGRPPTSKWMPNRPVIRAQASANPTARRGCRWASRRNMPTPQLLLRCDLQSSIRAPQSTASRPDARTMSSANISFCSLFSQIERITNKQDRCEREPLQGIPEMRTFGQVDLGLEWDRRLIIRGVNIGLNIYWQNRIGQLAGDTRHIGIIPDLEPGSVFRQRISDATQ